MDIVDSPIIQRIAQLRVAQKRGPLDRVQQSEMDQCLDWLVNKCYRAALLKNYSLLASMTKDTNWQHEICKDLEEL